jgi:hypothetical protein
VANTLSGSYEHIHAARRVASTIGNLQVVTVVLLALSGLITTASAFDSGGVGFGLGVLVVFVLALAAVYATFGWFEHTLLLLTEVAFNTVPDEDPAQTDHDISAD